MAGDLEPVFHDDLSPAQPALVSALPALVSALSVNGLDALAGINPDEVEFAPIEFAPSGFTTVDSGTSPILAFEESSTSTLNGLLPFTVTGFDVLPSINNPQTFDLTLSTESISSQPGLILPLVVNNQALPPFDNSPAFQEAASADLGLATLTLGEVLAVELLPTETTVFPDAPTGVTSALTTGFPELPTVISAFQNTSVLGLQSEASLSQSGGESPLDASVNASSKESNHSVSNEILADETATNSAELLDVENTHLVSQPTLHQATGLHGQPLPTPNAEYAATQYGLVLLDGSSPISSVGTSETQVPQRFEAESTGISRTFASMGVMKYFTDGFEQTVFPENSGYGQNNQSLVAAIGHPLNRLAELAGFDLFAEWIDEAPTESDFVTAFWPIGDLPHLSIIAISLASAPLVSRLAKQDSKNVILHGVVYSSSSHLDETLPRRILRESRPAVTME